VSGVRTRHFPGRDVPPYAEPVAEDQLVVGKTYFSVYFYDEQMNDPELEALVFIGRDLFGEEPGYCFQDSGSYRAGIRYESGNANEAMFLCQPPGQVHVMEFERALDRLLYCSLVRADGSSEM
jgi:hypothetical protein